MAGYRSGQPSRHLDRLAVAASKATRSLFDDEGLDGSRACPLGGDARTSAGTQATDYVGDGELVPSMWAALAGELALARSGRRTAFSDMVLVLTKRQQRCLRPDRAHAGGLHAAP